MTTVKALSTTMGDYGRKETGDVFEVNDALAKQLIAKGIAEETSEAVTKPEPELAAETGKPVTNPEAPEKGSGVTFTDKTAAANKEKQQVTTPATKAAGKKAK